MGTYRSRKTKFYRSFILSDNNRIARMVNTMGEKPRKSMKDVLLKQLKVSGRVIYVHRLIYVGEYVLENGRGSIDYVFQRSVKLVNDQHCDEKLTGFLLVYPGYFLHLVEGSEESLAKHLNIILNKSNLDYWGRMKLLVAYHHINQRFFNEWFSETAAPLQSLDKIENTTDMQITYQRVQEVVSKMYQLANALRKPNLSSDSQLGSSISDIVLYDKSHIINENVIFLPSIELLNFLLATSLVEDLVVYASKHNVPFELDAFDRVVWPLPSHFVPYNVFDEDGDPVVDLPEEFTENAAVMVNRQKSTF